jgi:hypothetical protein
MIEFEIDKEGSCFPWGERLWLWHPCGQCLMWAAQRAVCSGDGTEQSSFPGPVGKVSPAQAWVDEDGNTEVDGLRGKAWYSGDGEGRECVLSFLYC